MEKTRIIRTREELALLPKNAEIWHEEAAVYVGLAPETLYKRSPKKGGPRRGKRFGLLVYKIHDLDAWLEAVTSWKDSVSA